jgi:penicillin-binding protein 2
MLIFDQLKKNDPALRLLATVVFGGLLLLFAGLWWVQVVSSRYYENKLETQSYRTVRVPAPRGKILDRNRTPLAENEPGYNLSLYLEELSRDFQTNFNLNLAAYRKAGVKLKVEQRRDLARLTRYAVASNIVARISASLDEPLTLDFTNFERHYKTELALPLTVSSNLNAAQIARIEESPDLPASVEVDVQPVRVYPHGQTAVHLLGYVRHDDSSAEGEEAFFNHRLPDFRGIVGVEGAFDSELRGKAGERSELVDNLGYRQSETLLTPAEPGQNIILTVDLPLQLAVEKSLQRYGPETRGAVVVMDVHSGDVLAMASSPMFDPNLFTRPINHDEWERLSDERLRPQINRACHENYAPGSIFKMVVAMAALENGLNPAEVYTVQADPNPASAKRVGKGCIFIGKRKIEDTAPAGDYNFRQAFIHSSNAYFIDRGLRAGIDSIVRIGERLHLGELTHVLPPSQETPGIFPSPRRIHSGWTDGDTANACIGQGEVNVTPLQMAVVTAAIANGGKVLWPRLIDRIEPQDPASGQPALVYRSGSVRDQLGVSQRTLDIVREGMLADVEDPEGTGREAAVPGFRVCGKTGTAQVKDTSNQLVGYNLWFSSYAPYENPRYAVVIMIETDGSGSGGTTCAPVAREIYLALQQREAQPSRPAAKTLARN